MLTIESKNNYNAEFEKLIIMSMIFEYIDKYMNKISYKMPRLTGKQ